jgi:hypothetical protein
VAVVLSVVAVVVAVGSLWLVLNRGTEEAAEDPCRRLAWDAVPAQSALPSGWALASNRFFVNNATLTMVGPAPSEATAGPTVFVSVSCYGPDASFALARARQAALATGATDKPVQDLGDDSFAVVSPATGTTVYVQRGPLVADLTAPASVDEATLEALLFAVDSAMSGALAGGAEPSSPAPLPSGTASPVASQAPSAAPPSPSPAASPSPTPVSHVAPDLEARLPSSVDGTTLAIDSVTGAIALGTDATSQALIAALADLGKTADDLQIARARDPAEERPIRLYAFRVTGVEAGLAEIVADALLANTELAPELSQVTIAGVPVTKLTYSEGPNEYLIEASDGVVFNIETTEEALVAELVGELS